MSTFLFKMKMVIIHCVFTNDHKTIARRVKIQQLTVKLLIEAFMIGFCCCFFFSQLEKLSFPVWRNELLDIAISEGSVTL
jgi:hypothetical protein